MLSLALVQAPLSSSSFFFFPLFLSPSLATFLQAMAKSRAASVASKPLHAAKNLLRDFSSFFPSSGPSAHEPSSSLYAGGVGGGSELEESSRKISRSHALSSCPPSLGGRGPWRCAACSKICLYSYYVLRPACTPGESAKQRKEQNRVSPRKERRFSFSDSLAMQDKKHSSSFLLFSVSVFALCFRDLKP